MNVTQAVKRYKELAPQAQEAKQVLAELKDVESVLAKHMDAKGLLEYRGIKMSIGRWVNWDGAKLRDFLGDKAADYKTSGPKREFRLIGLPRTRA